MYKATNDPSKHQWSVAGISAAGQKPSWMSNCWLPDTEYIHNTPQERDVQKSVLFRGSQDLAYNRKISTSYQILKQLAVDDPEQSLKLWPGEFKNKVLCYRKNCDHTISPYSCGNPLKCLRMYNIGIVSLLWIEFVKEVSTGWETNKIYDLLIIKRTKQVLL